MEAQFKYNTGNLQKYKTKNFLKKAMIQRLNRKIIAETKKLYDVGCFTLLDAGCGEGFISRLIKSEIPNIKITGIEYTSEALQIAKAESDGIEFLQGDVCSLPFEDNSFDIVLCAEVLEHLKNPEKAFSELLRVSKKGLILTVPNEPWFRLGNLMVLKNLSRLGNPIDHINHWTAKGFAKFISNMTGGGVFIIQILSLDNGCIAKTIRLASMFWQKNLYLRLQTEVFVLYIEYILNNAQRVLTQVDRDKDSLTYGSCDRNYWHLKIRDFSSAILQQTSLTMALLYEINFENNPYFKNENMREWSISALKYLEKIQLKDGSFNEYYPNEHGYPPTAFILYSACMTYKILNLNDNKIIDTMKRTARYLASHTESKALNQEFAAITGLYLFYSITKEEWAKSACEKKLSSILEKQSSDGWFMEQGGADIGYSSVALDMLCEYYWHSKDKTVLPAIEKLVDFLQYFIHPNKTIGGEYGSRNTTYYMPNGFQTIALLKELPVASKTAETICEYVFGDMDFENHFMNSVDERYLTHYVLHSFLRALRKRNLRTPIRIDDCTLPCFRVHKKIFLDSGLVSFNNGTYFAICGARKGGVLKIFKKNKEVFADFGYRHACSKGKCSATNWLDNEYEITFKENVVMIKGRFNLVKQKVQSPFYHFALRISSLLLGKKINSIAKKILLFSNKHEEIYFTRKIFFEDKQVIVEDYIENKTGTEIVIEEASNFSLRLVASGKFFSNTDLLISDFEKFKFVDSKKIKKCFDVESAKKRIS